MFFLFVLSFTYSEILYLNNSNQVLGAICIFANSLMRNDLCFLKKEKEEKKGGKKGKTVPVGGHKQKRFHV